MDRPLRGMYPCAAQSGHFLVISLLVYGTSHWLSQILSYYVEEEISKIKRLAQGHAESL